MHFLQKAQIVYLKPDEALTEVPNKYTDFAYISLLKLATKLPKYIDINNHAIELIDNQQLLYSPIYNLSLVKLKILKTYIKNNLAHGFIKLSKSIFSTPNFFD